MTPARPRAFEHPALSLPVTEQDRERSLGYLRRAYGENRLTEYELDQRLEVVLTATTRRELNRAFDGLAVVPVGNGASMAGMLGLRQRPSGSPTVMGRAGASVAHLSGLATLAVGPGIAYAVAAPKSFARKEAAKAFNFQVVSILVAVGLARVADGWIGAAAGGVAWLAWFVLTLTGAVHAAAGENWRNPVTRAIPLRMLDEGPRPRHRELTR